MFLALGYDKRFTSSNYTSGSPAALGNYIAEQLIAFGLQDGSNEKGAYANLFTAQSMPLWSPSFRESNE
nr:hypothetical protein [Haliscomenobacter sp.]